MANFGKQNLADTASYAMKGASIGSIVPGLGTLAGLGVGAGIGFFKGLFGKKAFDPKEAASAAASGGYFTVPPGGYPGHPEWKPGTRQWIPPGSSVPGSNSANGTGSSASSGIDYDAIRAHAIAPSRAIYQNAMNSLDRQRAIGGGGGYDAGYGAQRLALARGMNQSMEDAGVGAEATVANTRLQEIGQQNQMNLGQQQLDIERKKLPNSIDKGINTTNNILGLIGKGADIYSGMTNGGQQSLFGGGSKIAGGEVNV